MENKTIKKSLYTTMLGALLVAPVLLTNYNSVHATSYRTTRTTVNNSTERFSASTLKSQIARSRKPLKFSRRTQNNTVTLHHRVNGIVVFTEKVRATDDELNNRDFDFTVLTDLSEVKRSVFPILDNTGHIKMKQLKNNEFTIEYKFYGKNDYLRSPINYEKLQKNPSLKTYYHNHIVKDSAGDYLVIYREPDYTGWGKSTANLTQVNGMRGKLLSRYQAKPFETESERNINFYYFTTTKFKPVLQQYRHKKVKVNVKQIDLTTNKLIANTKAIVNSDDLMWSEDQFHSAVNWLLVKDWGKNRNTRFGHVINSHFEEYLNVNYGYSHKYKGRTWNNDKVKVELLLVEKDRRTGTTNHKTEFIETTVGTLNTLKLQTANQTINSNNPFIKSHLNKLGIRTSNITKFDTSTYFEDDRITVHYNK